MPIAIPVAHAYRVLIMDAARIRELHVKRLPNTTLSMFYYFSPFTSEDVETRDGTFNIS